MGNHQSTKNELENEVSDDGDGHVDDDDEYDEISLNNSVLYFDQNSETLKQDNQDNVLCENMMNCIFLIFFQASICILMVISIFTCLIFFQETNPLYYIILPIVLIFIWTIWCSCIWGIHFPICIIKEYKRKKERTKNSLLKEL